MSVKIGDKAGFGVVSVSTSATLIVPGRSDRISVLIQNTHASNNLFVAPSSTLTSTSAIKLIPGGSKEYDREYNGDIYGRGSAAGTNARWEEIYD